MINIWRAMVIKNFLFHRIDYSADALWPPMKPDLFRKIIRYISHKYEVVNLEESILNNIKPSGKKQIATICFDDGYKDNIRYAAPILKEFNCPASFYIVTECIDKNIPTWTYVLDHFLQHTKIQSLELNESFIPDEFKLLRPQEENKSNIKYFKPWVKTLSNKKRLHIMQSVSGQCTDCEIPTGMMMNWDDCRELLDAGFTIGSHSYTHPMLAKLEEEEEIKEELRLSFDRIKTQINRAPDTISYPIGSFDDRVIKLSELTGYKLGLAVEQKFYDTEKDDRFAIPRVELYQEPWWKVQARINGIFQQTKDLWKAIKK